jgi:DNA-binding transcriptional LysR family regulator
MELRHLRYFVAAAEAENVSRAALRLHVSQPALSRQIRDLEDELRLSLFERSAKSVRLTAAGRAFLDEARAVLQRADQAVAQARAIASGARGEIHVGYAPSPTVRLLPLTLRAFQGLMPNIHVRLHDLTTEEMLAGLREEKLQVAVMVRPGRGMLRGLHFEELLRDSMCLAVPPGHALARARVVALARVARERLVVYNRKDYPEYHEYLDELFAPAKLKPTIAEEHDSATSLITAIETGTGVAIVPQSFSCSTGQRLRLIPIHPAAAPIIVGVVWRDGALSPARESFVEAARMVAGDLAGPRKVMPNTASRPAPAS